MTDERAKAPQLDREATAPAPKTGAAAKGMRGLPRKGASYAARCWDSVVQVLARVFAFLSIAAVIVFGVIAITLRAGPIDISRFAPLLSEAMSAQIPGGAAKVDGARLALPADRPGLLSVALEGFAFYDDAGQRIAEAPTVSGLFGVTDLLKGRYAPQELIISDVRVAVRRLEDGRLVIDAAADGGGGDGAPGAGAIDSAALTALLSAQSPEDDAQAEDKTLAVPTDSTASPEASPDAETFNAQTLNSVLVLDQVELIYGDDITGREWRAEDVRIEIANRLEGVQATAAISVEGGRFGGQELRVNGYRAASGALYLNADFANVAVGDIASQITALEWLSPFEAPVAGRLQLALDGQGLVTDMTGSLSAGAGLFRTPGGAGRDAVTAIQSANLDFTYEPLSDRFLVSRIAMDATRGRFEGEGLIELERGAEAALTGLVGQLNLRDVTANAPELFAQPLQYDRVDTTARLRLDPFRVEIGEVTLAHGDLLLAGAGVVNWGEAISADLILRGGGLSLDDILMHWPVIAAKNARKWVAENLISGEVADVNASVRLGGAGAGIQDVVSLDFTFSEVESRYLDDMPPIRGASGAGQLDLTAFHLTLDEGEVQVDGAEAAEPLQLAESRLAILGLDQPLEQMEVDLVVTGPAAAMLSVINRPPLRLIDKLGTPLTVAEGQGDVAAQITFPLLKDLRVEDVRAAANARLTEMRASVGPEGLRLTAPLIEIDARETDMALTMRGRIEGAPVTAKWQENFESGARSVEASSTITPGILAQFGIEQPWFPDGKIDADASISMRGRGDLVVDLRADVTGAALVFERAGFTKPSGAPGRLSGKLRQDDRGFELTGVTATLPGAEAAGDISVSADGDLRAARLSRVAIDDVIDGAVIVERDGDGWRASVSGAYLSIPGALDRLSADDAQQDAGDTAPDPDAISTAPPLAVSLDLGRLQLTDEIHIAKVQGTFRTSPAPEGVVNGLVGGTAPARLTVKAGAEGARALRLTSNDAGHLMRELGVFDDGAGGTIEIRATMPDNEYRTADGALFVNDLIIHDDAKLEGLLVGGDLDDLRAKMSEEGLRFDKIKAGFRWRDNVLSVDDAIARGGDIGVTIDGVYFIDEERLDMKGVFTPLYGVNTVLGAVPVLGKILTGGKGEGIFGLNYTVKGSASDPNVIVNPLSLLTPGILRKLVDGDGEALPNTNEDR